MLGVLLALSLAQPISSGGSCAPGKVCKVRTLTVTGTDGSGVAVSIPNPGYITWNGACPLRSISGQLDLAGTSGCATLLAGGASHGTGGLTLGANQIVTFAGAAAPVNLASPATVRGLQADATSQRLWQSDLNGWAPVGTAPHPVLERRVYSTWQAAAGVPQWTHNLSPQIRAANWNLTVGACVSSAVNAGLLVTGLRGGANIRTESATCTTTAVANNVQGVHVGNDLLLPFGRRFMWCGSVGGITTNTSVRVIAGQSKLAQFTAPADAPTLAGAWFRYSTAAGDTNWMLCTSDGVSAATCTSTGVAVAGAGVAAVGDSLCIDQLEGTAVTAWVNGRARLRVTTNITTSDATTGAVGAVVQTLTAGARVADLGNWSIEGPP